ncbi:hypothetical protein TYRP_019117 [Tyrophagus putrescentiae]|nr:hypothetical protein TYRP_019117 [Tyrophagus putrescentiae]
MPSKKQLRFKVHRQKETGSVDDASLLHQTEVLLEKMARKVLRRIEKGHQRAVFAPVGDQTGTGARGVGVIGEVGHQDAVLLRLGAHLLGKVIVTDGAEDGGHSRLTEEPLGHSNGVLHCPTGDHLHRVVGSHVLHQCPVLLLRVGGEDARIDALLQWLAQCLVGEKAAHKGVTGTVSVHNVRFRQGAHFEATEVGGAVSEGDEHVLSTLGDHHRTGALARLISQQLGLCLGLIAKENVHVGHQLLQLIAAQVRDVRRGEVDAEELALGRVHVLRHEQLSVEANQGVEASGVDDLRLLHQRKVLLQVLQVELLRGAEVGAQGAVLPGDQTGAGAGGHLRVDEVGDDDVVLLRLGAHLLPELIVANGAHEGSSALLRKEPLGDANGVLSSTAGDVLHLELVGQVLAQVGVLVTGEDGIVRLQVVLVQKLLIDGGAHVQQRIAQTENLVEKGYEDAQSVEVSSK